ncbi:hypothetical protein KAR91_76195 [Candidatus Pacearchaeota archaeon]|nr:hypothetical protein [Candidatus Pacearchaeota archaeon]
MPEENLDFQYGNGSTPIDPNAQSQEPNNQPPEPGQGSQTTPNEPGSSQPPKPKVNLFEKGKQQGLKDAERNKKEWLQTMGFDPDNFEAEIQMMREMTGAKEQGKDSKGIVKAYKEKIEQLNREKIEAQKSGLESERNYLIDSNISMIASNLRPFNMKSTIRDFKDNYFFEVGENGVIIKDKKTDVPLIDTNGNYQTIEDVFDTWSKNNLYQFQSTSQGGANIHPGQGTQTKNPEIDRFFQIQEKLKIGQQLTDDDMGFFQKNKNLIVNNLNR